MKFVKFALLSVMAFGLYNCGLTPIEACKEIITATCQKSVECADEAAKKATPYLADQASCEAALAKIVNCDAAESTCKDGKTYSTTQAKKCVDDFKAQSCEEAKKGSPASCSTVCQ